MDPQSTICNPPQLRDLPKLYTVRVSFVSHPVCAYPSCRASFNTLHHIKDHKDFIYSMDTIDDLIISGAGIYAPLPPLCSMVSIFLFEELMCDTKLTSFW